MFDHNIFQDNLVGVDFCEKMVKETNPGVWEKAEQDRGAARRRPRLPHHRATSCGRSTRSTGEFYREALQMSRMHARDVLPDGRPARPSLDALPGRRRHRATVQLFTDYLVRLMKYVEFMKKVVPLHDDLFDFFYEACPATRRSAGAASCWAAGARSRTPSVCDYTYENMTDWGRAMFVTPGVVVDGKLVTNDLVDINLGIRILLGSSYYDDWEDTARCSSSRDPLGNPVDRRHPWNQTTIPKPQKRDFDEQVHLGHVAALVRRADEDHLALDTGGGPIARLWATALGGPGRHRLRQGDRPAA